MRPKNFILSKKFAPGIDLIIGALGFVTLLLFTCFRKEGIFWDEEFYIKYVFLVEKYGISFSLFREYPAAPLYAIVHHLFTPFTHADVPGVRLLNVFFLLIIILLLSATFLINGQSHSFQRGLSLLMIPMIFVVSGMALSEIPALLFLTGSLFFIALSLHQTSLWRKFLTGFSAGLCLGVSVLGRQPLLVAALPIVIFMLNKKERIGNAVFVLSFIVALAVITLPVFWAWGGLLPPRSPLHGPSQIAPFHAILSYGYAFVVTVIVSPGWFPGYIRKKSVLLVFIMTACIAINYYYGFYSFPVFKSLGQRLFGPDGNLVYESTMASVFCFLGLVYLPVLLMNTWNNRNDVLYTYASLSTLLLLFTPIVISEQYSSRYLTQAAPFLIIILNRSIAFDLYKLMRFVFALLLGMYCLNAFFLL